MTARPRASFSLIALLLLCSGGARAAAVRFQRIDMGGWAEHGVFCADVDGDGELDILSFSRGRIAIFRAQKGKSPVYPATPELLRTGSTGYFADVADVLPAPGKEIVLLTPAGVAAYSQKDGRYEAIPVLLLECDTLLTTQAARGAVATNLFGTVKVLPWNFAFDANGDGRDDLIVPHGSGTDVRLQTKPGQFSDPMTLPILPVVYNQASVRGKANYLVGQHAQSVTIELFVRELEARDVNGDGKRDLVWGAWWFAQKTDGTFDPSPAEVPHPQRPTRGMENQSLLDIDGNGHTDRIEAEHSFDDPLNVKTLVRYWLAGNDGALQADPNGTIAGPNILVHMPNVPVHDFNGDGKQDFVLFQTDLSVAILSKWIRQAFGKIEGKLNFFIFDAEHGRYSRSPTVRKNISINFKLPLNEVIAGFVWIRYLGTMMRFEGDFNADGKVDLLVRDENTRISIYYNVGGKDMFTRKPSLQIDETPMFAGMDLDDLNGDGASDLILYAGFDSMLADARTGHVIAVYISQLQ
ncbi:VCBS repeat-containing protein [bacterium]|nr:VCBS repeat-containing protein [bacterium]